MTHFNIEATRQLNRMRLNLVRGVQTSTHPLASAKVVNMMFEVALDTVLPLGERDPAGRDPDNLRGRK